MNKTQSTPNWSDEAKRLRQLAVAIGIELRRQRECCGLTQYELSIQADMSPATLSTLESRRALASIEKTMRLCSLLGLTFPEVWQRAEIQLKENATNSGSCWEHFTKLNTKGRKIEATTKQNERHIAV